MQPQYHDYKSQTSFHTRPILSLQPLSRAKIFKHNLPSLRPFIPFYLERSIFRELLILNTCNFRILSLYQESQFLQTSNKSFPANPPLNVLKFKMEFAPRQHCACWYPMGITVVLRMPLFHLPIHGSPTSTLPSGWTAKSMCFSSGPSAYLSPWAFTRVIKPIM